MFPPLMRSADRTCLIAVPAVGVGVIAIRASVGRGGVNRADDVRTIQAALNDVKLQNGDVLTLLAVDGIAGPLTNDAITDFQKTHTSVVDGRVDPNGPTLRALNAELGLEGGAVELARAAPAGAPTTDPKPGPRRQIPNPYLVALVVALLPKIRAVLQITRLELASVGPFVTTQKQKLPDGLFLQGVRDSLTRLDKVFGFFSFNNPRPVYENLQRVYANMEVALNRSFDPTPQVASPMLFVPNTFVPFEKNTVAYTEAGGAFLSSKEKLAGSGDPANRVYLCSLFIGENELLSVDTVFHELAHFVSQGAFLILDQGLKGQMVVPAEKPAFDKIEPFRKVRSAGHYAFYAVSCGKSVLNPKPPPP